VLISCLFSLTGVIHYNFRVTFLIIVCLSAFSPWRVCSTACLLLLQVAQDWPPAVQPKQQKCQPQIMPLIQCQRVFLGKFEWDALFVQNKHNPSLPILMALKERRRSHPDLESSQEQHIYMQINISQYCSTDLRSFGNVMRVLTCRQNLEFLWGTYDVKGMQTKLRCSACRKWDSPFFFLLQSQLFYRSSCRTSSFTKSPWDVCNLCGLVFLRWVCRINDFTGTILKQLLSLST